MSDNDPSMTPDELSWASQNAGMPPQSWTTTQRATTSSEEFAARARAHENELHRQNTAAQHRQDMQYNAAVHAQDMAAARAQHLALLRQYSFLDRARAELGALAGGEFGWKQGFVIGVAVGAIAAGLFSAWQKRK
jgi:hypothetical protein